MIICYAHKIGARKKFRETYDFIQSLIGKYTVFDMVTEGLYGYWDKLAWIWGQDDIIIIEGDIAPTIQQLEEIIQCKHKNCASKVKLVLEGEITSSCRDTVGAGYQEMCNIPPNAEFCDLVGFGCTKISKELQLQMHDWFVKKPIYWRFMDAYMMKYINENIGKKLWHIHSEVKHLHKWKPEDFRVYTASDFAIIDATHPIFTIYKNLQTGEEITGCCHERKPARMCLDCYQELAENMSIKR